MVEKPNNLPLYAIMRKMSSNIPNWEAIINKVVTSKEGDLVGNVEATDESAVLVSTEGARTHYRIPKEVVEGFDGHAVSLKVTKNQLEQYKTQWKEGFGEVK